MNDFRLVSIYPLNPLRSLFPFPYLAVALPLLIIMDRVMGSKALAAEVRILLQEVGKLRDEKRALQYEVAELLASKVSN